MDFTIISYAMGRRYEKHYWQLQGWADRNKKYKTDFHILPEKGDYYANTRYKPSFILQMLEKYQAPVLWLDVDSIIKRDIGEYIGGDEIMAVRHETSGIKPYYACCLYFPYNESTLALVKKWKYLCDNPDCGKRGDHTLLLEILPKVKYFPKKFLTINTKYSQTREYAIVNAVQRK